MEFIIRGLPVENYNHMFGMTDAELATHGAKRYVCNAKASFPDRIEMRDAEIGETLLLINHTSMDKNTPYKASHAIFVREGATKTYESRNKIPPMLFDRILSLRAFDQAGMMLDAKIATGTEIKTFIAQAWKNENIAHIDAHTATRGCFMGRFER